MINKLLIMLLSIAFLFSCSGNKSSDKFKHGEKQYDSSELQSDSEDLYLQIGRAHV